jgi:hypothetical protein
MHDANIYQVSLTPDSALGNGLKLISLKFVLMLDYGVDFW